MKTTSKATRELVNKLHPLTVKASDKMYYVIGNIVGEHWVNNDHGRGFFSITSNGDVIDNGLFMGGAEEFYMSIIGYLNTAKLTVEERELFWSMYDKKVTDGRRYH